MISRRLLVRSDSTIADLHSILQIVMGWEGYHLHQFIIRGKRYGVPQPGGMWFPDDPTTVQLADLESVCFWGVTPPSAEVKRGTPVLPSVMKLAKTIGGKIGQGGM